MKNYKLHIALILISLILSLGIVRTKTFYNLPGCFFSPICPDDAQKGTLHTRIQGYPLIYRQVTTFTPDSGSQNNVTGSFEQEGMSKPHIMMNIIFWYSLLFTLTQSIVPNIKNKRKK